MKRRIVQNHIDDGIDRRGMLHCMAWAGTGVLWTAGGGILTSRLFGQPAGQAGLHFVQISDTHLGFNKAANPDVAGTLRTAVEKINALDPAPDFIIHTGDLSHTARASEFDDMDEILKGSRVKQVFTVPGEHDTSADDGRRYLERYGKNTSGRGWYSFDHKDVHFAGLSNVAALEGLGKLGEEQLTWLENDLKSQPSSRPIVIFAHIPLWSVYPEWGWGTEDSALALRLVKRFGSVTVLNGHIHQVMQKVEGSITFHTALSTAFPQPAPGMAKAPGPMKVADEELRRVLGVAEVHSLMSGQGLAIVDRTLAPGAQEAGR